ncbi:uncharacterized protein LOC122661465 [Telopea speciosissima]|uniref:uncharacterized protein LOC122661465 n=1 Tax=Telopea speciosissima TaxID=54955 RepID=UPI001CC605D1|nr:uncharacterized protein LOC122661465 [Telopea speciosissima]
MFDFLFGWRKASKCKKLIRHVQCRLKLLKNKRGTIIRQLREDVAQLLKLDQEKSAFARVEQLFKDKTIMAAYDLLDHFCEFIALHFPYIRRHRDCPNDINEAVSSLIYAAAWCGDLPELQMLRKLFGERYGHRFVITAVELLPGNLVNSQIIEKLRIKSIPEDVKLGLLDEIAKDYSIQRKTTWIMESFELRNQQIYNLPVGTEGPQDQVNEKDTKVIYHSEGADITASNYETTQGKALPSSLPVCENSESPKNLNITQSSSGAIIVAQPRIDTLDSFVCTPSHKNAVRAGKHGELDPSFKHRMTPKLYSGGSNLRNCSSRYPSNFSQKHKVEGTTTTASESSIQFPEMSVIYLDDIEESNATIKDGKYKDQRIFIFKSINMPTRKNLGSEIVSLSDLYGYNGTEKQIEKSEPWDGRVQSRSSRMRTKSSGKRLNRRLLSWGSQVSHSSMSMNDVESALYYGDPCDNSSNEDPFRHKNHHPKKHQRKMPIEDSRDFKYRSQKNKLPLLRQDDDTGETKKEICGKAMEGKPFYNSDCRIDREMVIDCSLEHPCYFFTRNDKDEVENMCIKQHKGIRMGMDFPSQNCQQKWQGHCCNSPNEEEAFKGTTVMNHRSYGYAPDYKGVSGNIQVQEMGWDSSPQRDCQYMVSMYAVTDYKSPVPNMRSMKEESVEQGISDFPGSCVSSHGSCSSMTSPLTERLRQPPYLRAQTMPLERPQNGSSDVKVIRSASFQLKQTNNSTGSSSSSSSSHVHPKLPDYDDLAAKFKALKKEHLQSKFQSG